MQDLPSHLATDRSECAATSRRHLLAGLGILGAGTFSVIAEPQTAFAALRSAEVSAERHGHSHHHRHRHSHHRRRRRHG